jgi:deoxyribonuclease-4
MRRHEGCATDPEELLGAHVSAQGGLPTTPQRGVDIGATAIQVFTKTPSQWKEPVLDDEVVLAFRTELEASGLRAVVSHDSYLINLASPDPVLRARSVASFIAELERCERFGIPFVVSHPGNYMDDPEAGLARNAAGYTEALRQVPGPAMVCLETTAGSGTALGATFEQLAALRAMIADDVRHRIGFCADTCHLYAAGYDLVHDFDGVWAEWERRLGLANLHVLHLNDSKTPFDSRVDRHELVAEGTLGAEPFRRIMREPRFRHVIKILETPKGDDMVTNDRRMLHRLRGYARGAQAGPRR